MNQLENSGMKYIKTLGLFEKVLEKRPSRLLGLDVGMKYVGLAVSDAENKVASPLSVLKRKKDNINLVAGDIETLVSEFSLGGLVVGYPYEMQGEENLTAVPIMLFIQDLQKTGKLNDLCYTFWDERYSSACVESLIKPLNLSPLHTKSILDKFSAVGILQGYLDHCNQNWKDLSTPNMD